jgi:hypothetical protein
MQKKTNLFRIAAAAVTGFILGAVVLFAPSHPEAQAADDLYDALIGNDSSIMAVPMQVGRETYGLAMVDTKNQTLWIYEISNRKPGFSQLRLMAARSWEYDCRLTDFNSGEPSPQAVKKFLEGLSSQPEGGENAGKPVESPLIEVP